MTDKEKTLAFIEERIKWNEDMMQRDPKPSDIGRIEEAKCIRRFVDSLQEESVSIWHDSSEMPKEKKVCLIRYSANDGASTNNFEVVIAEPLTRRFVTRSYPHKTGYQHTIHGETTIKVDEYQDRREKIPFSDIDEWAYIDDLLNINL